MTKTVKLGRRPKGSGNPRDDILRAAQKEFGERGFDRASIRAVARRARVNPALVYHYFRSKENLFRECVRPLIRPPPPGLVESLARDADAGTVLVRIFLERWAGGPGSMAFAGLLRSASASPKVAAILRELVARQITPFVSAQTRPEEAERRVSLLASALLGAALVRFVVGLPGFRKASLDDIARSIGPTVMRYLRDPPPPSSRAQ